MKYEKGYVGYDLVGMFQDEGISGLRNDREGLNKMMSVIKRDNVDMVVVYSLSRLGRKLVDVIGWIDDLEKKKFKEIRTIL